MTNRILVFNFFGGVIDRGIPLYAGDIAQSIRSTGAEVLELRCPTILRRLPRPLRNLLFVVFEQVVAPAMRAIRRCSRIVYPYNSAGLVDAVLGRSVLVVHDLIAHKKDHRGLAASYIRVTQAFHRLLKRPICAASSHTLTQLRRLGPFNGCSLELWSNPFFSFEAALARHPKSPPRTDSGQLRILLCSGLGPNKDYAGAIKLFVRSHALETSQLRVVGFGHDAYLARRRLTKLPERVAKRIEILPRLSLDDIIAEYASADLVWVHSHREGFGRSVIEARLSGRPVIASNIGAFRRLAGPGVTLYRVGGFDAAVRKAITASPAPALDTIALHHRLEAAISRVLGIGTLARAESAESSHTAHGTS
jgi:glycosyltransferase involved in cell wall biosynthesis